MSEKLTAAEFKRTCIHWLTEEDLEYVFQPNELKEYHKLVCDEMKEKIAKLLSIINIGETENIGF